MREELQALDQEATASANDFDSLFQSPEASNSYTGRNPLDKTATLTQESTNITNTILKRMREESDAAKNSGEPYAFADQVRKSQENHNIMDDLIHRLYDFDSLDLEWLKNAGEEEFEKMIRSQQSKRSRAKSKYMDVENYRTMMIGAVAENILRIASGKPKSAGGGGSSTDVGFTDEKLAKLAMDPEELKKAIRNIQSKKSIMKSKAEFADDTVREAHPRWLQLLEAEEQLIAIRDRGAAQLNEEAKEALELKKQAEELLADVDLTDLPDGEATRLLAQVKEMLVSK